jgi:hypothetical protein
MKHWDGLKRSIRSPFSKRVFLCFPAVSIVAPLIAVSLALAMACAVSSQQSGSIEFIARVAPTGGHPEPVREFTFFLLRKNYQDIQQEADSAEPASKMDDLIGKQDVSPELRAWMKKHQIVELSGPEFLKALTPVDILGVPEFKDAYFSRNKGDPTVLLPQPKFRESDKQKNPEKYKQGVADYQEALKRFIAANPGTLTSMYVALASINPGWEWKKILNERSARVHRRALELAELQYLVIKTDTDLDGRGQMNGLAPGDDWLTTLDGEATAGDARVRWNMPVHISSGRLTLDLSNLNGVETQSP